MHAYVGVNLKVEVSATFGSPVTVTDVSVGSPGGVANATAHGFVNGDILLWSVEEGMIELDGLATRVANKTNDTFELEGVDVSGFSDWISGTVRKVASFTTFQAARSITMPDPPANKLEKTVLIDRVKKYEYGLPDAPDGSIEALFNPTGTVESLLREATREHTQLVFRLTWADGYKRIFAAKVVGGSGMDQQQNAVANARVNFTPENEPCDFVS